MRMLIRSLLVLALLACAGCTKAGMLDARRDHILAGPHGAIDITLHAPPAPTRPASGAAPAPNCLVAFSANGEALLRDDADLARADAAGAAIGYRFVVPAGTLDTELTISGCVKEPLRQTLAVALEKEHLAVLAYDGRRLALKSNEPWTPASLDTLRDEVAALRSDAEATDGAVSRLTRLSRLGVLLSVALVAAVIVLAFRRR